MTDEPLYPASAPFREARLPVDRIHELYYAEFGNPGGFPALFLHGGPGSGCNPQHARLFDPKGFRLLQLDQRGCGASRPSGELRDTDIDHLIDDLEALRTSLDIERWLVYGGSWGGTLALEYAKRHPEPIQTLVLRAPFLARRQDLDWFTGPNGVARELSNAYARLCTRLECSPDDDLIARLYQRLNETNDLDRTYEAALAWDDWEASVMGMPQLSAEPDIAERQRRIARKRVYAHYCQHGFFVGDAGVMQDIDALGTVTTTIVHGRQDRICLHSGSEELVAKLSSTCELHTVKQAGHALSSTELQAAVRQALDQALTPCPTKASEVRRSD